MSDTPAVGDTFAAMQLHDAAAASVSTNRHHFRFLDLAAEIRNRIYDFAAEAPPSNIIPKPGNGPTIGLIQVCRQIRDEFRKIYMQNVPFTVRDKDVVDFAIAFFETSHADQQAPIGQHPIHVFYLYPPSTNVDILPLLKLKMAFPQTEVTIIPDPAENEEHFYTQLNCEHITHVLENTSPALRHDIRASKISEFCCHHDSRFYLWYKLGHVPHGVDMTLDREGVAFANQIYNMIGVKDMYGIHHGVAFEGIDVRNSNNSSRAGDVEKGLS
ncbi:hypothetical protein BKA58DRAFT_420770 [Alternaria rosae]|uniref:uncharacterized protein n=1 Tax=Alternaria rosae TaxID=1187941 RepID=UPI001E8E3AC5|nr:uncharacterized protein BKA58DRAFT_420770 [Alternaria rosae]KAH6870163.1 hypothetical protein BKA58DRAFT_420770 [Alternaria rosae]